MFFSTETKFLYYLKTFFVTYIDYKHFPEFVLRFLCKHTESCSLALLNSNDLLKLVWFYSTLLVLKTKYQHLDDECDEVGVYYT